MNLLLACLFSFIIGVAGMYMVARVFGGILGFGGDQTQTAPSEVQPLAPGPDNTITTMPPPEELRKNEPHPTESQPTHQGDGG